MRTFLVGCSLCLLLSACQFSPPNGGLLGPREKAPEAPTQPDAYRYRTVLSSKLNANNEPSRDMQSVLRTAGQVYLVTKWFDLQPGPHDYRVELYDGYGELLWSDQYQFTPQGGAWSTWSWYSFRQADRAGPWRYRVTLNGTPVFDKPFAVLDGDAPSIGISGGDSASFSRLS